MTATVTPTARSALLQAAVFPPYVNDWTPKTWERIRNTLGCHGPHATPIVSEPDITRLVESLTDAEPAVVQLIWDASNQHLGVPGQVLPCGARLYRLDDFLNRGWRRDRGIGADKLPDFVVAHPDPTDPNPDPETKRLILDVVVEFKGPAAVNGGWGYCCHNPADTHYSNQVICYTHGCWLNLDDDTNRRDFAAARFVWIGPDRYVETGTPWGTRALNEADKTRYPNLLSAIAEQEQVAGKWAGLRLSHLEDTIRSVGGGSEVIADLIRAWGTAHGILK